MKFIALYWIILFTYSIYLWAKNRSDSVFLVNDRKSSSFGVAMSLVSLVFGASSVFGLAGYAYVYSINAVWWTLSGVLFLILLRFLFVEGILSLKAYTISDSVAAVFGERFKIATSFLILVPWIMILAGQIIAGGTIINLMIGDKTSSYVLFCLIFFSYTVIAGQSGTVRTSFLQTAIMIFGIAALLVFAVVSYSKLPDHNAVLSFGFNSSFTPMFFLNIFIPVGLSYLFGPDIYSRIFPARDAVSAKRGITAAAAVILIVSAMIIAVGIFGGQVLGGVKTPDEIIPRLASSGFNGIMKSIVLVALVSIPLSGADAMLANMGTLLGKDIAGGIFSFVSGRNIERRVTVILVRVSIAIVAVLSVMSALHSREIIPTLLAAYRIFSVVAVPLIMISMLSVKYGVQWKNILLKKFIAVYMILVAVAVALIELKVIVCRIPYINLIILAVNLLLFLSLFAAAKKGTDGKTKTV